MALGLLSELRPPWAGRLFWFDAYHALLPRTRHATPVVIVEIDDGSLARLGQWPWPRIRVARLIDAITAAGPTAIGLDVLMPEPDRLSPPRLPALVPGLGREVVERLRALPDSDALLAEAVARAPAVVGVAGLEEAPEGEPDGAPTGGARAPVRVRGGDPMPRLRRFAGTLRSLPVIDAAARGHGLLNVDPEAGVVRRLPLAAAVGSAVLPAFAVELLRVGQGAPEWGLRVGRRGVESVDVGPVVLPTQPDGSVWLRFSPHVPERFVAAADVLDGQVGAEAFAARIVLIGVTALGLADYQATPVGERMSGVEIHAQLIEAAVEGRLLRRPPWAVWVEAALIGLGGLVLVAAAPVLRPRFTLLAVVLLAGGSSLLGILLYQGPGVLLDAASPVLALTVVWGVMTALSLAEADGQRRALSRQLAAEREAAARVAGELAAARRIQQSLLPDPAEAFPGEGRFAVTARLEPARVVGGDLYDFFRLDDDRVFLLIGDVSGKGVPGSLFMAVSKALCKSTALRAGADLAQVVREANREISRDNREAMFVTAFAAILDARTGVLAHLAAGHDAPYVLGEAPGRLARLTRLEDVGGPPLCVVDDFPYQAATTQLTPGTGLCFFTDGVTEARSPAGELFGRERLEGLLRGLPVDAPPDVVADAVLAGVRRFTGGAEAADDVALVVLRWQGPDLGAIDGISAIRAVNAINAINER